MMPKEPNQTHDELPCDFLAFLEQRLGLDEVVLLDKLGTFLVHYERSHEVRAERSALAGTRRRAPVAPQHGRADAVAA